MKQQQCTELLCMHIILKINYLKAGTFVFAHFLKKATGGEKSSFYHPNWFLEVKICRHKWKWSNLYGKNMETDISYFGCGLFERYHVESPSLQGCYNLRIIPCGPLWTKYYCSMIVAETEWRHAIQNGACRESQTSILLLFVSSFKYLVPVSHVFAQIFEMTFSSI